MLSSCGLSATVDLIQDIINFSKLKVVYRASKHQDHLPEEPLYSILKRLDLREQLSDLEADWLLKRGFDETLEIYWQQEDERKAIIEFLDLKARYHIDYFPDTSIPSPLYSILKKLKGKQELQDSECEWLERQALIQLTLIDRNRKDTKLFKELKVKYKVNQYKDSDPSCKLFSLLRDIESKTTEDDIRWLLSKGLTKTAEIAKGFHFKLLKAKYQILGQLTIDPFYEIMLKLERREQLDPKQVIQLIEEGRLSRHGKIATAYYELEAIFYEKEYQRTKNMWNLPSASSSWRKAGEPQNALKVTDKLDWHKAQESDLKSALWVTRGAAFRDLSRLDESERCASQAMECQPDSHQPYTLLGAICYDTSEYEKGDKWFEMAADRGADDTDDEIERIVRMTKDRNKRREIAEYLLEKNPGRYGWASSYLR